MISSEVYLSVYEVLNWVLEDLYEPKLRCVETEINSSQSIIDITIKESFGGGEEKAYAVPIVRANVRRGNSILLTFKTNDKTLRYKDRIVQGKKNEGKAKKIISIGEVKKAVWVRRGLCKFFDVLFGYFVEGEEIDRLGSFYAGFKGENSNHRKIVFFEVEKAILEGNYIEAYQTEKANGENAQVTYCNTVGKWIISSKNCCLLAANNNEVEVIYKHERYYYAKLIAKQWFDYLETCANVEELKLDIRDKTLIGEYIGNKEHIHIVEYQEVTIKFYAIVDNNSCYTCIPVLSAFRIFHKYKIDCVAINRLGVFNKISELYLALKLLFKEISIQDLKSSGEGSVIYFVKSSFADIELLNSVETAVFSGEFNESINEIVSNIAEQQFTLSLGKIKTLEYRIYRKIRENIKNIGKAKTDDAELRNKFINELETMTQGYVLVNPLEYYLRLYDLRAEEHRENIKNGKLVKKKNAFQLNSSGKRLLPNCSLVIKKSFYFFNENLLDLAKDLGFTLNTNSKADSLQKGVLYSDLEKEPSEGEHLVIYAYVGFDEQTEEADKANLKIYNASNCPQKLLKFCNKKQRPNLEKGHHKGYDDERKSFYSLIQTPTLKKLYIEGSKFRNLSKILSEHIEYIDEPMIQRKRKVYIVLPITIPGSGKTFCSQYLHNFCKNSNLKFISVESDQTRKKIIETMNLTDPQQAFKKSGAQVWDKIREKISNKIKPLLKDCLVYIDKNMLPKALIKISPFLKELKNSYEITTIGMIPNCTGLKIFDDKRYMMSYNLLVTSMHRVLKRRNHILSGTDSQKLVVVLQMFSAFLGYKDKEISNHTDHIIRIPFANELVKIGDNSLRSRIESILDNSSNESDLEGMNLEDICYQIHDLHISENNLQAEFNSELSSIIKSS